MERLRWLVDFAIDYGSVALIASLAAFYLWGSWIEPRLNPSELREGLGIPAIIGLLLAALAIKLWRDVRVERRRN